MPTADIPNPGSGEAIKLGCKCPVIDNHNGLGYGGGLRFGDDSRPTFVVSQRCKIHWKEPTDADRT